MQRYWSAKQGGDKSANLERSAGNVPTSTAAAPERTAPPGVVSPLAAARIRRQDATLALAGFDVPPPLYAPGTVVTALGKEKFHIERKRVEDMPTFQDASAQLTRTIELEDRRDTLVEGSDLHMTPGGQLIAGDCTLGLEESAFTQLALLTGFGAGSRYLARHCSPGLRATNVNAQLEQRSRSLVLRTRRHGQGRSVYAIVTPTYAAVDSHQVLDAVSAELSETRVEMRYDGTGARATALFMPDQIVDLAAGDIFKAGVRIQTDDTGRGRIVISAVVYRNLCLNLILIGEGRVDTLSRVHRGDPQRILEELSPGVELAKDKIADFLDAWGHARTVKVDPPILFADWLTQRKLVIPGVRTAQDRDQAVELLLGSWDREPGDTLADAVNAVTRAAHENPLWGVDIREELERQASRLVLIPA